MSTSCHLSQEELIISLLKKNYSNLYVNDETAKREVIKELEDYFKENKFNDKNISEINLILNKINDGHVVFKDSRDISTTILKSGLNFVAGSNYIKSCPTCSPVLPEGKYSIVSVDGHTIKKFIENQSLNVSASTPWGRDFKTYRLLEKGESVANSIVVTNEKSKSFNVKLNWEQKDFTKIKCVETIKDFKDISILKINTLWCNHGDNSLGRKEIFDNFKKELEAALALIDIKDSIIIDLRENGGGGDAEVELVLNAFNNKSVQMYKYQYLSQTEEGRRDRLINAFRMRKNLWSIIHYQNSNLENSTQHNFYSNKIVILTSPGCFSSCEGLTSAMQAEHRALVIGKTTHGGAGGPLDYKIQESPYILSLPSCLTWQQNGKLFEGVGVRPDIEVHQAYNRNEDTVLLKAIDLVQ